MNKKIHKQKLLERLYESYKDCTLCPLGFLGRSKIVFGSGNPDAKLMLIGEGPGQKEDEQGLPFVGRSGQLLTKTLENLGITRSDIYIANIVKCRPPKNRAPFPNEFTVCKKLLLDEQIKIIQPKVICTLGASSLNALLERSFLITKIRGSILSYQNTILIPTYHPAYILRNAKMGSKLSQDLRLSQEMTLPSFLNNKMPAQ